MKTIRYAILLLVILLVFSGCKKVRDYFHDPETEEVAQTIETAFIAGYAANITMSVIKGHIPPNVKVLRTHGNSTAGTALISVSTRNQSSAELIRDRVENITIAALWADESTAIITVILSNYHAQNTTLDIISINTIPVIEYDGYITAAFAGMDFDLAPDANELLSIDLTEQEVNSELLLLDEEQPEDIYIAVEQNAYFISVDQRFTPDDISDDEYLITGGGQMVEIDDESTEVYQKALLEILLTPYCVKNPTEGFALLRKVNVEDESFPELGTAVLEFHSECDGRVDVMAATGSYIGSNGSSIDYNR